MHSLRFFDCNASFGRRSVRNPGSFYRKEELLQKMTDYGIERALVYHAMAKEYDPQVGNGILAQEIENEPRLCPVWALLPHYTGEFDTPDETAEKMRRQGVRAVTMFPSPACQFFSLAEFTCGEIFTMLEAHHIPLFIGMDQLGGLAGLEGICARHPELRVVVTGVNYRIDRDLYPLLAQYPYIYIETSGYKTMDGVGTICARFGAGRLLFGTGMPVTSGSGAVGLITYASISDEEKQMIAAGNLEKLLGGVRF